MARILKRIEHYLPGLGQCWVLVFLLCVVGGLAAGAVMWTVAKVSGDDELDMLLQYLIPFLPAAIYIYCKGNPRTVTHSVPLDKSVFGTVSPILLFPLLAILAFTLSVAVEPLSAWLPMPESIRKLFETYLSGNSLSAILSTVVAAPLIEELLCRGIMERGLLFHSTPRKAILWSAFLFAFIHMNPWQAIPAFVIGIFLGWIYWRTHSLWACIFIHFVNNGSIYVFLALFPEMDVEMQFKDLFSPTIYPIAYIACIIFTVSGLLFLHKRLGIGNFDPATR